MRALVTWENTEDSQKKRRKVGGAAYKPPKTYNQGLFNSQELENFLTAHRAFDNPGIKGVAEKGRPQQENTRLVLRLCPPRLREVCTSELLFAVDLS